jgi:hypothetical protein
VTLIVKPNKPEALGVPLIAPLLAFRVNPVGKFTAAHV